MKCRALFLLTVFMLNTLVGFSCALHMDMDQAFSSSTARHVHKHAPSMGHSHTFNVHKSQSIYSNATLVSQKENCCKALNGHFLTLLKDVPSYAKWIKEQPVAHIVHSFQQQLIVTNIQPVLFAFLAIERKPPTEDIRIHIQSFQI